MKPGDRVSRGQLLIEIDDTTRKNTLRDERAALGPYGRKAGRLRLLSILRAADIGQTEPVIQERSYRAVRTAGGAKRALAAAQADIAHDESPAAANASKIETAQARLAYTRILAPMAGTVVALSAERGRTLNTTSQPDPAQKPGANRHLAQIRGADLGADLQRVRRHGGELHPVRTGRRVPTRLQTIDWMPVSSAVGQAVWHYLSRLPPIILTAPCAWA
ncbi:MAG: hypothetical protein IPL51_05465 [Candidatus Competibacteraceae bacterium]|nr:hypothetical protein [Candidatus Competibacteraceae bacterium]